MPKTLKGFLPCRTLSGLIVDQMSNPMVVAALQPWAEISERLRRIIRGSLFIGSRF